MVTENSDPKPAVDDGHPRGHRVFGQAWTAALRAGLSAWLLMLAVAVPGAAWHVGADFANGPGHRRTGTLSTLATCSRSTVSAMTPIPVDGLFRRRDVQYRNVELQLLQRGYARLRHGQRHIKIVRRHRHHPLDSFVQYQRWLARLYIVGAKNGVTPSTLASGNLNADLVEDPNGTLLEKEIFPMMPDGFAWAAGATAAKREASALELSGGSIADTRKVTVDADGGVELHFTPNWSFTAKLDGEIRPQPQLYAGSGTLNYSW